MDYEKQCRIDKSNGINACQFKMSILGVIMELNWTVKWQNYVLDMRSHCQIHGSNVMPKSKPWDRLSRVVLPFYYPIIKFYFF